MDNRQYKHVAVYADKPDGLDVAAVETMRNYIAYTWVKIPEDERTFVALAAALGEPYNRVRRLILAIPRLPEALGYVVIDNKFLRRIK